MAVQDAEPVEKPCVIWYGSNYVGNFNLTAHKGALEIQADPPPSGLHIAGRWINASSQQFPAVFPALPVGEYTVTARYRWTREEKLALVQRGQTSRLTVRPDLGGLDLAAQPADAKFRLASRSRPEIVLTDRTPAQLRQLPVGEYHLRVQRGDYLKDTKVEIKRGETNHLTVAFEYGQVQLVSDPPGATVYDGNEAIGQTPKVFNTLKPARYRFRLEQPGYEPAQVTFEIKGDESLTVLTNLVNLRYKTAMQNARRLAGTFRPDYPEALASVTEALEAHAPGRQRKRRPAGRFALPVALHWPDLPNALSPRHLLPPGSAQHV